MNTSESSRRSFFRSSRALIGAACATFAPAALLSATSAQAQRGARLPNLWNSAEVFIGQSVADQAPSLAITCPLFFTNGHDANASHTLDLGAFPVRGDVTWHGDTITPDLGRSLAASVATGTDGLTYLLVAAEGEVSNGAGHFSGVTRAIVRCKYKVAMGSNGPLLVACNHCVVVLVKR